MPVPSNRNHSTPVTARSMTKAEMWDTLVDGAFHIYTPVPYDNPDTHILCICPCGCGMMMDLPITKGPHRPGRPGRWGWDGNRDAPTLAPSIRDASGCRFHGHLQSGIWTFVSDSGQGATR